MTVHQSALPSAPSADAALPLQVIAAELDDALRLLPTIESRLHLIARRIPAPVAFSTSLGLEDQALTHAIAAMTRGAKQPIDIFTLDTGRHFPETLDTLDATTQRYKLRLRVMAPNAADLEALVAADGINGFRASIDARKACCNVRKVKPLRRALSGANGWITGLRRGQSAGRGEVPFATYDDEFRLIKLNPLADWSLSDLEAYISTHDIPVNPLHARGFPSIGCQPCTRAIAPGEDIRAGRWWWENLDGKECGLHNRPKLEKVPA